MLASAAVGAFDVEISRHAQRIFCTHVCESFKSLVSIDRSPVFKESKSIRHLESRPFELVVPFRDGASHPPDLRSGHSGAVNVAPLPAADHRSSTDRRRDAHSGVDQPIPSDAERDAKSTSHAGESHGADAPQKDGRTLKRNRVWRPFWTDSPPSPSKMTGPVPSQAPGRDAFHQQQVMTVNVPIQSDKPASGSNHSDRIRLFRPSLTFSWPSSFLTRQCGGLSPSLGMGLSRQ